ncbi:MAG: hypothetical protein K2Y32_03335 [Candidatus Obscuribacterales bacterium]|nr:hypothetical protein [Candidatus Obscuribacterales bacterium]
MKLPVKNGTDTLILLLFMSGLMILCGILLLIGMFLGLWRVAVIFRAYLNSHPGDSALSLGNSLGEAKGTLERKKGRLCLLLLEISLLQIPALLFFVGSATLLLFAQFHTLIEQHSGVAIAQEVIELLKKQVPTAILIAAASGIFLNNFTICGIALSVLMDRPNWKVLWHSFLLTFQSLPLMTFISLIIFTMGTFIETPDIINLALNHQKIPGYSEPVWVLFGRTIWKAAVDVFLWPISIGILLETIREQALGSGEAEASSEVIVFDPALPPEQSNDGKDTPAEQSIREDIENERTSNEGVADEVGGEAITEKQLGEGSDAITASDEELRSAEDVNHENEPISVPVENALSETLLISQPPNEPISVPENSTPLPVPENTEQAKEPISDDKDPPHLQD